MKAILTAKLVQGCTCYNLIWQLTSPSSVQLKLGAHLHSRVSTDRQTTIVRVKLILSTITVRLCSSVKLHETDNLNWC